MLRRSVTALAIALATVASAAIPLRWTVETSRAQPAAFEVYQGETLDLDATLTSYGKPLTAPSDYALYWQTNGMGRFYWSTNCTPVAGATNVMRATWRPEYDVGSRAYNCFIGCSGTIYRAAFQLRMLPSPGAKPNTLPLPTPTIDFSRVTVLNPPWPTNDLTSAVASNAAAIATNAAAIEEELEWLSGLSTALENHQGDTGNPHGVTADQVGAMATTGGVSRTGGIRFGAFDDADPGVYSQLTPDGLEVSSVVEEGAADTVVVDDSGITIKTSESRGIKLTKDGLRLDDESEVNWPTAGGTFAKIEDIPPPPGDYASVSNAAMTAVQPSAISDMETQTHAEATYQPKGSYLTSESDPSVDAKLAPIETTVNAWQTYWDGDDVRVTVTNYYGSADLPALYLEQKISDGGTNYYKVIWTEKARLAVITDRLAQLEADVATKADRAWGFYDSHTGEWAPDGFTSISSGSILISRDTSYQKTVTASGCEFWVLTANDPTVITGTETNGFLRISDSDGNSVFEVVKGDKRTVPATCSAVSAGNNSLTVTYNVVAAEHPSLEICGDLANANWMSEDEADCPATVVWNGSSGNYVATVTGKSSMSKMFVKGTYEVGGETYVRHGVPVGFDKVMIGGVYYRVTVEAVSGKKLMVLTEY